MVHPPRLAAQRCLVAASVALIFMALSTSAAAAQTVAGQELFATSDFTGPPGSFVSVS